MFVAPGETAAMPTPPSSDPSTANPPAASPQAQSHARATRLPLPSSKPDDLPAESPDPEQDVAPNLGGESQMQDA